VRSPVSFSPRGCVTIENMWRVAPFSMKRRRPDGGVVLSIAYVSVATKRITDDDVAELLQTSRLNNQRDGVTGALLFHRDRFIQIMEGADEMVLSRFATIAADPRHRDVRKMREKSIETRQFPAWTMGFRTLSDESVRQLDGFEDFFARRGRARLEHSANEAQQFLEWLGEYWLPQSA
jgi:hypothetical protein